MGCSETLNGGKIKPGTHTYNNHAYSTFPLLASGLALRHSYENAIERTENPTILLARSLLQAGKLSPKHYVMRAEILINLGAFKDAIETYLS